MKKFALLAVCFSALFVFSGCGGGDQTVTGPAESTPEVTEDQKASQKSMTDHMTPEQKKMMEQGKAKVN